jgi:hypothetical protein
MYARWLATTYWLFRGIPMGILETTAAAAAITCIYILVLGAQFFAHHLMPGGDTQTLWSMNYLAIYSVRKFGEFMWWDPTALNGWPAYYLNLNGWFSMLSPFQLLQFALGELVAKVTGLTISGTLVLDKTIIAVAINIVGVILISRELIRDRVAVLLPPLIYALCHMQFFGYGLSIAVESLPQALFLLFAIIHFNNRRNPASLLVLIFFAGIYCGSINYLTLLSHFYPFLVLAVLFPFFFPGFYRSIFLNAVVLWGAPLSRLALLVGILFMLSGIATFLVDVLPSISRLPRIADGTIPFDYSSINAYENTRGYGISSTELWTGIFAWIPFSDFHAFTLKFDPYSAGHDYRYIGLATLPLTIIALVRGFRNRYVLLFAATFFLCTGFVAYTMQNLPFSLLISESSVFKNIRTMSVVMPRDLVALLPIFIAGIGLDLLLRRNVEEGAEREPLLPKLDVISLNVLIVLGVGGLLLMAVSPSLAGVKKSLGHIGFYLPVFSLLILVALRNQDWTQRRKIGGVILALTFVDLTISASHQWLANNQNGRYTLDRSAADFAADKKDIAPIRDRSESWAGTTYNGLVHNVVNGGPLFGIREWLALITRPSWQPVIQTWDFATRMQTQYPFFQFFSNGVSAPFDAIKVIDSVERPALPGLLTDNGSDRSIWYGGSDHPIVDRQVGFVENAQILNGSFWFKGWAVDRSANKPARTVLIFVGRTLWGISTPSQDRPDIGSANPLLLKSGFAFNVAPLDALTNKELPVRVFALMDDGAALELGYSVGYPFSTTATATELKSNVTFYINTPGAEISGNPGHLITKATTKIERFTLNSTTVRVNMPEPGYMLFMDNYDPQWTARVNGDVVPVLRANFTFKAVKLPAGDSTVEWVFSRKRQKAAWSVYYICMVGFVLLLFGWSQRIVGWAIRKPRMGRRTETA